MKAAQIIALRRFEIVEVEKPQISKNVNDRLLIKLEQASICGSDIPFFMNHYAEGYPMPAGFPVHECIGIVAESTSNRFKEGDMVLSLPDYSCGLNEFFLSDSMRTIPLPKFEPRSLLVIAQPLGTVICAMRKLDNLLDMHTVVIGQGPMGLLISYMLSNLGAKTIVALDVLDYRLEVAEKMRVTHRLNVAKENPVPLIAELTGGKMADIVVEAVGHQTDTINQSLDLVRHGGTVLSFGVPDEEVYNFRFSQFFRKNIKLIGSVGPDAQNDFSLAVDMIAQSRIDVSPIVTHKLPFADIQKGFDIFCNRRDGAIKVIIDGQ